MHHFDENLEGKYSFYYWGPYLFQTGISPKVAKTLLSKGKKLTEKFNKSLAGQIENEFVYSDTSFFMSEFKRVVDLYLEGYRHFANLPNYKAKLSFKNMWINYQKKNEYNPPHIHTGCSHSFVIYLKMPKQIKKEYFNNKTQSAGPGSINFSYGEHNEWCNTDHGFFPEENTMFVFPSFLKHHVESFKSDVTRITVAGNFSLIV
jgi:uncharacterized protein (TIGR02466 family)